MSSGAADSVAKASIESILVAVELNETCHALIRYAELLATRFDASVDLLHVWQPPLTAPVAEAVAQVAARAHEPEALRAAEQRLRELARESPRFGCRIEAGEPVDVIVAVAQAKPYDLLLMGTHGRAGLRRFVLGSVTERVLQRACCPVITLRNQESD